MTRTQTARVTSAITTTAMSSTATTLIATIQTATTATTTTAAASSEPSQTCLQRAINNSSNNNNNYNNNNSSIGTIAHLSSTRNQAKRFPQDLVSASTSTSASTFRSNFYPSKLFLLPSGFVFIAQQRKKRRHHI